MLDETSLAERLKFMSITRERTNMTKKHLPEFRKAIGSALEVFYKRMAETPATARMVPSGTDLHRTRSAQAAHWERLLGGELDQDYIRTSRHIGETHARIGIEPQWYMGGYGLVLSAMIQELVPAMLDGRLWGRKVREAELTEALSGLVSLAVLDMELGVSTYIEALERQRDASKAERDRLASAIDRLSSAMEEMTSNIGQTAQSSAQTESLALQVAQGADENGRAVQETVVAVRGIADRIRAVQEIARQTDLLALNAAVEAARVGEVGAGFAVVAKEVRKLAERVALESTDMQSLSAKAVEVAEVGGRRMNELVPNVREISSLVSAISAACREQSIGAKQINDAIQDLDTLRKDDRSQSGVGRVVRLQSQSEPAHLRRTG